jgi:hypothetical protein
METALGPPPPHPQKRRNNAVRERERMIKLKGLEFLLCMFID